ncbi:hypothetical protein HYFRA_00003097 [Hymenoscyphus fraxineus]|uniref:Uncharacterized protein n=1 Tax=Hymenoscyphus fraxineus TaxID=746836 RepID=A0A9N9KRN0_9HELO|nr:hypothetical protein HYFRA_00003097 [Hymenoscyphus fraxineus]
MKFTYAIAAFVTTAAAQRWPATPTPVAPLPTTTPNPTSNIAGSCDYLIYYDGTDDEFGSGGGWWCERGPPDWGCANWIWKVDFPYYVCITGKSDNNS